MKPMAWEAGKLRLGTCSWTAKGWEKAFYPPKTKRADYISAYAERFSSVEIDASFYGVPRDSTLDGWREKTPPGFVFAAKAPREITHDRFLMGCERPLNQFLFAMDRLQDKRGPILFQFPYYAKRTQVNLTSFLERLHPFLDLLPRGDGHDFALEVRNKTWISPPLLEMLAHHEVALALIDHPWMSSPKQLFKTQGIFTAPFTYIRWLGDRKGIEEVTQVWNESVVDRKSNMDAWIPGLQTALDKTLRVHGYVNNHYGGYAPNDVAHLEEALAPHVPQREEKG
jgi:uncharacterized protein YecE (DUF72 family)